MKTISISALVVVFLFAACGKYEDGPAISLRSKTARVANTWKVEQFLDNGNDETPGFQSFFPNYREVYDKDGNYSFSYDGNSGSGTWMWQSDKLQIKRVGVSSQNSETLYILRLKEKEFWYYVMDGSDRHEYHLVPAD